MTLITNVDCGAHLPFATTQPGACAPGTFSRDGTDTAAGCRRMSAWFCPPGYGFSSRYWLCVQAFNSTSLAKPGNPNFQKKAWYGGCLRAAKLGSQSACELACRGPPAGCCTGSNPFDLMPPLLGLDDLVCSARSCSGWGCCEASADICAGACAAYSQATSSSAASVVSHAGAVADDGFCTACPAGKSKCTWDASGCLAGNCSQDLAPASNLTVFYLTGLVGAATASTSQLPLHGPAAAVFGNASEWHQPSGTLTLRVAAGQSIAAGASLLLTVPLANPLLGQQSPRSFAYISGLCARPDFAYGQRSVALPARYVDVDLETRLEEAASAAGDGAPLLVRSPSFVVRSISQSNPVAGPALGANVITLTLVPNVDMDVASSLTIRGLAPTSTPSSPRTLLVGGYSASSAPATYSFYADTWSSNDRGATWLPLANASSDSWSAREGFALASVNASIFLAGGWGGPDKGYLGDVWRTQDAGRSWQLAVAAAPWHTRGYFEMTAIQGRLFLAGGQGAVNGTTVLFNDVWTSHDGVTWSIVTAAAAWSKRYGFGMAQDKSDVVGQSLLFVAAGITCRPGCTAFDLSRSGCGVLAHTSVGRVDCCTATSSCVEMYSVNDVYASSDEGSTWTLVTSAAGFSVRSFLGMALVESGLLVFGGYAASGSFFNDLWLSEDGGLTWREISAENAAPGARSSGRLVALGSGDSCLVVGGWKRGYIHDGVGAYYYSDSWVVPEI